MLPKNHRSARPAPVWASQNFLTAPATISRILKLSGLNQSDHVIEIGPGKGNITRQLLRRCGSVSAVELDRGLFEKLSLKFENQANLRLFCGDFLQWRLPQTPYKVFANIPFCRTTEILRKLTKAPNPPEEAWLVVEKGAAKRFLGQPHETLASLQIKPFFQAEIRYYFRREDFHPAPSVDAVLLHLRRKAVPDVTGSERQAYRHFVSECWNNPGGLHKLLTKKQISAALKCEKLSCDVISREMLYVQWLCLFRCYLKF